MFTYSHRWRSPNRSGPIQESCVSIFCRADDFSLCLNYGALRFDNGHQRLQRINDVQWFMEGERFTTTRLFKGIFPVKAVEDHFAKTAGIFEACALMFEVQSWFNEFIDDALIPYFTAFTKDKMTNQVQLALEHKFASWQVEEATTIMSPGFLQTFREND